MSVSPIRTDEDLAGALAEIGKLLDAPAGGAAAAKLEVLSELVHAYEQRQCPMVPPEPRDAIRFRLEQLGLKPAALAAILGSRSHAYEVLKGTRRLTVGMIRRLHAELGIPLASLIGS